MSGTERYAHATEENWGGGIQIFRNIYDVINQITKKRLALKIWI